MGRILAGLIVKCLYKKGVNNMSDFNGTPHIQAKIGEIADLVLMPGDPLRAEMIAKEYLQDVTQFNYIRNMFGYTGYYQGKRISVMGSGMGMPSIGIYSYELFKFYGVNTIIRIGSAGSYSADVKVYDVVLAKSAYSQSTYGKCQNGFEGDFTYPDADLNNDLVEVAKELDIPIHIAPIHSSDVFYSDLEKSPTTLFAEKGCVCVEMESFALFHNASILGKKAACLCTISDNLITHEVTSALERQNSLTKMIEVALGVTKKEG